MEKKLRRKSSDKNHPVQIVNLKGFERGEDIPQKVNPDVKHSNAKLSFQFE